MNVEELVGKSVPHLELLDTEGRAYSLRRHIGHGPLVVFFIIRNGTPG